MTDHPGSRGPNEASAPEPVDPYASLFRPAEEPLAVSVVDEADAVVVDDASEAVASEAVVSEAVVSEAVEHAPAASPPVERPGTGRLFRSAGAAPADGALPAISSSQASRLRTMVPASEPSPPPVRVDEGVNAEPIAAVPVITASDHPEEPVNARARRSSRSIDRDSASRGGRLTGMGVYALVIGVTVVAGFVNVLLFGPEINAITGVVLAVVSVVAALLVRRADDVTAIIAPPLAFGLAAVTAAQIGLSTTTLANRFITAFFTLGNNWFWVIGSALAAMVIVAVRRRSR